MINFNTDGMFLQRFAFKAPVMDYILKNLKPAHPIKLYQCCKFFFSEIRLNIIRHLEIVDDDEEEILDPTKTIIRASNTALKKLADFWISDSFTSHATYNVHITLPTFSRCTIKKLELSGTIEELKIKGVFDEYGEEDFISIEDIIMKVPKAKSIEISESALSPTTFSSLVSLKHCTKFSNLVLQNMTNRILFKEDLMVDFVLKNADVACKVLMGFKMVPGINDLSTKFVYKSFSIDFNDHIALLLEKRKKKLPKQFIGLLCGERDLERLFVVGVDGNIRGRR
uniref:F-box domain-containing protein n=1 Tax=Panagrolaimus sp. PS1159 TaxID=55785 RepID=A0AC35F293_9BILA